MNPKRAGDTVSADFEFAEDLVSEETITSQLVTATVYSGTDASPSSVITGAAESSGSIVTQDVRGGVAGVTYAIKCRVTTSGGQVLNRTTLLAVE